MKMIVQMKFGSHLYGTSTPQSDTDIKGVFLPSPRDILLQQVKPMISQSRSKEHGEKNTSQDIDREAYSLQRYLELLSQGQTVALDMLFAPDWAMIEQPDQVWLELKEIAPCLITKGATSFVKYCRQQANKYGIKGSRVAASRLALVVLRKAEDQFNSDDKLEVIADELKGLVEQSEFLNLSESKQPNGERIKYFEVCGKKALLTSSIKTARKISENLVNQYGQRALAAEKNEGVDWKALSHAVRVGHEAIELFTTGKITFPRPEAEYLLKIKQGKIEYRDVAEEIEKLFEKVENSAEQSKLPDEVDERIINDFIMEHYGEQVRNQ